MKYAVFAAATLIATGFAPVLGEPVDRAAIHLENPAPFTKAAVRAMGVKVADYHIAQLAGGSAYPKVPTGGRNPIDPKGWEQGAFFIGLTAFADATKEPRFAQVVFERGKANEWALGNRVYHADDHMMGQTYLWAARHGIGEAAIAKMRTNFDTILANPSTADLKFDRAAPKCIDRWCWCDALFMAPAAWIELSNATGDARYKEFALREFWATTDYLFDPTENLYFRDSSFFDERDAHGKKLFWARGNGWVFGGLARMIPLLKDGDPEKVRLIALYRKMAARLLALQTPDGYWSPSLLADPKESLPESSGTSFYVYGMAWGVNAGILDRATYAPAIRKGWVALTRTVHADGRLGWVQAIGDRPTLVRYEDTHDYAVGAFLLAGTEVEKLAP
jgi:rhamnogalacturonyl hydrolase YesR